MGMPLDVLVFLNACDQKPCIENASLYHKLICEEFNEYIQAKNQNDEPEQLDACMDMIWVILGYCQQLNHTTFSFVYYTLLK